MLLPQPLLTTLLSLGLFLSCRAQDWKWDLSPASKDATAFNNLTFQEAHIAQCQPITLQWNADGSSTGPYTVFAYPVAAPANQLIQKSEVAHALSWDGGAGTNTTIRIPWTYHTVERFMMTIMDSKGKYGGVSSSWFPLTADKTLNPSCGSESHPAGVSTTQDSFRIAINRNSINTCNPVGIALYGGERPYTITIVGRDSPAPLNKTLSDFDTFYTWVPELIHNSDNQDTTVIIFATDKNGRTTLSTPLIQMTVNILQICDDKSGGSPNIPQNFIPIAAAFPTTTAAPLPSSTLHPPSQPPSSARTLSAGELAGIIIGSVAGIFLLWIILRRVRMQHNPKESATELHHYSTTPHGPSTGSTSRSSIGGSSTTPIVRSGRAVNRPEETGEVLRERDGGRAINFPADPLDGQHELLPPSYGDATSRV